LHTLGILARTFTSAIMADYQYGGSEEENAELYKLEVDLVRVANIVEHSYANRSVPFNS
jgi:hypothetical protein